MGLSERLDSVSSVSFAHSGVFWWVLRTVRGNCKYLKKKSNFKTRSHGIIHTFKNYFVTVFSVFSNKRYPNRPLTFKHAVSKIVSYSSEGCLPLNVLYRKLYPIVVEKGAYVHSYLEV